jgi:hypothetical protein
MAINGKTHRMDLSSFARHGLPNGRWTSKLGEREDIEHSLHDLTGMVYGSVVLVLKRPIPAGDSATG